MKNAKKKLALIDGDDEENEEAEDGVSVMEKKRKNDKLDYNDDDYDGDGLDEFENDGFIVDDDEEEEEEEEEEEGDQDGEDKQKRNKKKKRKILKDLVLDDDDLELLQENQRSGLLQPTSTVNQKFKRLKKAKTNTKSSTNSQISDDDVSFCDFDAEEEEAMSTDEEDEMENFIVYDENGYDIGAPAKQQKLRETNSNPVTVVCSSPLDGFAHSKEILKHHVVNAVKPDDPNQFQLDNYTSERDNYINETDMPERMQMFEEIAGPAPDDEMSREGETSWILKQLAENACLPYLISGTNLLKKINKDDIMRFLELRHLEKYDIPFIAMYRKEKCLSLLGDPEENGLENKYEDDAGRKSRLKWHKTLWAVNDLDKKWLLIQKRKSALQMYYSNRYQEERYNFDDVAKLSSLEQNFDTIMKSLKLAETERDIDDLDVKFNLCCPPPEEGMLRKFRQPKRRLEYSNCSKAGLWKLAGKFGCSAEQFGLHLTLEKVGMNFWEDPAESPELIALDFICPMFKTPEAVLKGARLMAALEISCEPSVRKHVRGTFMDKAVVSTCPTPEGNKVIDNFHMFYGVKWLCEKPLDKFQGVQWLLLHKAEEEKLLNVTIKLPESVINKLITDSQEIYLVGSSHGSARLWDEQRKMIIQEAFSNFLLPVLEKEARAILIARAKNWLLSEYGWHLWNKASVAPYQQEENASCQEAGTTPRVMACCWGPGRPPITFAMLGSSGQLLDVLETRYLGLRSQNVIDQQRKRHDQQCVLKFIINYKPNVIVLGAANIPSTWLKDVIEEIILQIEENPMDGDQIANKVSLVYGDESFAQVYENSKVSSCQLPGQEGIVKRAVALGRYLQNPLAMIATLSGPQKEIVSWKLHSLDHFLTPDEKYGVVEMVLVDITNQVGMDINFAISQDWLSSPLQFVSGLGPQKAALLRRELVGGRAVNNRQDLAVCGLRTKKIFYNAVGFLRVCSTQLLSGSSEFELLDDTRIHPEVYDLAERLAKAVHDDVTQAQPILYLKDNPQLLNDFNVDDYADNCEIEEGENKRQTLHDIKSELLHGFLDPRQPYEKLSQDEVFYLVSGQNDDALAEGRIIQVIVRRVLPQRAFCALDSGLTGVIMKEDYLDGSDDFSFTEKLHEGDIVTCKVKELEKSRYQVLLTCKESELKSCKYQIHQVDPYYSEGKKNLLIQRDEAQNNKLSKKHFKQRIIDHSCFKNITGEEATELLGDKEVGNFFFHPSSRGPYYLTLTLKVYDGLYVHKDIIEDEKDSKDITSLLCIGKTLKIADCIFKDLDEVMDLYVKPLVGHLKAMTSFRKFKRGSKAEVDELLRAEKSEHPMRIGYCFSISYEHPGSFILSYVRTNLHHEYVGLHPKGFKFRKQIFPKVELVVAYFQKHIDDVQHSSTTTGNLQSGFSAGASTSRGSSGGWQSQLDTGDGSSKTGCGGRKDYSRDGDGSCGGDRWRGRRDGDGDGSCGGDRGRGRRGGRGRGCGRGRGDGGYNKNNESEDFDHNIASKWGLDFNKGDGNNGRAWESAGSGSVGGNWCGFNEQNEFPKTETNNGNWGGCSSGGGKFYDVGSDDASKKISNVGWGGSDSGTANTTWGNSSDGAIGDWNNNNETRGSNGGTWCRREGKGGGRSGSWDHEREGGRGRGRGRGCGRGYGHDSYNSGDDNTNKETVSGGWGSSKNDIGSGGSWSSGGAGNAGYWNGRSASGGWGGSGNDNMGGGNWRNSRSDGGDGTAGWSGSGNGGGSEWNGRGDGNRGGSSDSGRGRGGRNWSGHGHGRGFGCGSDNGRGDNSYSGKDFRAKTSNWGTNSSAENSDGMNTFSGGNAGDRNWGGNIAGGNWNSKPSNDSKGILGSGPASGNDWLTGSSNFGKEGGWGNEGSSGWNGGGFKNDLETGTTGWGGGPRKSSSFGGGGSGWS